MNPRKRMLIQKGRIGGDVEVFAKTPNEVLTSDAWKTAPYQVQSLLTVVAAQYRGYNNGSLTFTRETARNYGMTNPYMIIESFAELEARGLIIKTRLGTTEPPRSAMFALSWCKIDPPKPGDEHQVSPTIKAPNDWARWVASQRGPHWTTPRRDRSKEKERVKPQFTKATDARRSAADGTLAVFPVDTRTSIHGDTRKVADRYPRGQPRSAETRYPRGHLSEISGVGEQGKPEVAGGKPAGRPEVGEPISPQAEIQRAPPAALKRPEGWRARYQEILMRVLETVDSAPRRARRLGKPHLEDPYWAFAVALLCEGTGMDAKEVGNFLGRLVKSFSWSRVKKVVQECEALMLWGFGAIRFVEDYPFLLPAADQDDVLGVPATSSASAGAGNPDRRLPC